MLVLCSSAPNYMHEAIQPHDSYFMLLKTNRVSWSEVMYSNVHSHKYLNMLVKDIVDYI